MHRACAATDTHEHLMFGWDSESKAAYIEVPHSNGDEHVPIAVEYPRVHPPRMTLFI